MQAAGVKHVRAKGHAALRRGRVSIPGQIYLVTTTTFARDPVFADFDIACAVCRSFEHGLDDRSSQLLAWVLMPDHAHWLLQLGGSDALLNVVKRLKSLSALEAKRVVPRKSGIWSRAFHDHAIRTEAAIKPAARYLIANPVRAGLVEHVGAYPFWNAVWL